MVSAFAFGGRVLPIGGLAAVAFEVGRRLRAALRFVAAILPQFGDTCGRWMPLGASARFSRGGFPFLHEMYQFGTEIRADEAQANVQLRFDRVFSQLRNVVFGCSLLWKMLCDTSR